MTTTRKMGGKGGKDHKKKKKKRKHTKEEEKVGRIRAERADTGGGRPEPSQGVPRGAGG